MTEMPPLVALVGNPNAGKSALFNALTGARQKIANYPGVTVERKSGRAVFADGRPVEMIDLPGAYSLSPDSLDEAVTRDVVLGNLQGHRRPDALVIVLDAGNLDNHLRFALELIAQGLPTVVALNMIDLAERDGLHRLGDQHREQLGQGLGAGRHPAHRHADPLLRLQQAGRHRPHEAGLSHGRSCLLHPRRNCHVLRGARLRGAGAAVPDRAVRPCAARP